MKAPARWEWSVLIGTTIAVVLWARVAAVVILLTTALALLLFHSAVVLFRWFEEDLRAHQGRPPGAKPYQASRPGSAFEQERREAWEKTGPRFTDPEGVPRIKRPGGDEKAPGS